MRIDCVGGGPAGLYFAILMKRQGGDHEVTVYERDPAGQAYGWGVVLWDELLRQLEEADPESAREVSANLFHWSDQLVKLDGRPTASLGGSGHSIGRQRLLDILARRAGELGVEIRFESEVDEPSDLGETDLIVAADGVNSRLRRRYAEEFGTKVHMGRNKYVWLGTTKVFSSFNFPFVRTEVGWIWFHAYGFSAEASTCVVECPPETWTGLGFDQLSADEGLELLQRLFARHFDGNSLISPAPGDERLPWLSFPTVTNRRWHRRNLVLLGDAAHTTHFTIGSGTRFAIEDAIALSAALRAGAPVERALEAYGKERQEALRQPQRHALYSARWFEAVPRYVGFEPAQFGSLLNHRYSRLLARIHPRAYLWLLRLVTRFPGLKRLRNLAG